MSILTGREAEKIAAKLSAQVKPGRKHDHVTVRVNGILIGQFNLRRNSDLPHNFVAKQLYMPMRLAIQIARCDAYLDDYVANLIERMIIPPSDTPEK